MTGRTAVVFVAVVVAAVDLVAAAVDFGALTDVDAVVVVVAEER